MLSGVPCEVFLALATPGCGDSVCNNLTNFVNTSSGEGRVFELQVFVNSGRRGEALVEYLH